MIFHNQFCGSLFPHFGNAGNIICRITHQCLQVDKFRGCDLVFLLHIPCIIIFYFRFSHPCLWNTDFYMIRCNLQQIPVPGYQGHLHAFRFAAFCHGPQNIVCFIARKLHNMNVHGRKKLFQYRNLLSKFLGHRLSGSLVCIIHLMTKCRCMDIKSHCQIGRFFLLQNLTHNIQEA